MHREEITQLIRSNEEMKGSWHHMTTTNSTLRAQLNLVESTFTSEQRDPSTRLYEYLCLRSELSACLSCETVWKQEMQAVKNHTLSEIHSCQSEYQQATSEHTEVTGHLLASTSTSRTSSSKHTLGRNNVVLCFFVAETNKRGMKLRLCP